MFGRFDALLSGGSVKRMLLSRGMARGMGWIAFIGVINIGLWS